jgi:hypothetical protein
LLLQLLQFRLIAISLGLQLPLRPLLSSAGKSQLRFQPLQLFPPNPQILLQRCLVLELCLLETDGGFQFLNALLILALKIGNLLVHAGQDPIPFPFLELDL